MNVFKTSLLATALIAGGAIAPAHAADNVDLDVTITITESCDITSTDSIDFTAQAATPGTATATGSVDVQCTKNSAYGVALSAGNNSGNDINARKMKHASVADTIAYQLYLDAGHANIWGLTDGTDTASGTGTGFGGASFDHNHVVYAQATIVGTETAGDYSDVIKATVTF